MLICLEHPDNKHKHRFAFYLTTIGQLLRSKTNLRLLSSSSCNQTKVLSSSSNPLRD